MGVKRAARAVDQVQEMLKDNKRALETLDFLEEKNRQYRTKKRYTYIFYLVTAAVFLCPCILHTGCIRTIVGLEPVCLH